MGGNINVLLVILVIAFFGLLAFGAIAAFVISVIQQRQYDTTALPDLGFGEPEEEATESEDEENEVVEEYRFEQPQEELILEDEETNQLMKNIARASGTPVENSSKPAGFSLFKSKKTEDKGKEGEANADSQ